MDEKKAIQKDKLRAAPLIKLNVGDLIEQTCLLYTSPSPRDS